MAVPKKRTSHGVSRQRRNHDALKTTANTEICPSCMELKLRHQVCPHCGKYKGRQVLPEKTEAA